MFEPTFETEGYLLCVRISKMQVDQFRNFVIQKILVRRVNSRITGLAMTSAFLHIRDTCALVHGRIGVTSEGYLPFFSFTGYWFVRYESIVTLFVSITTRDHVKPLDPISR